jgi:glycosyltransferase involved in cell wall biosynthesis
MISFVIPAHNEERLIGRTLAALHAAARAVDDPYEIIVVDDASTDATAALAASHGALVVPVQHRHIAAARNAGARHARGDVLIFVDADTCVSDAVMRAAMAALGGGAIGGGARARFDGRIRYFLDRAGSSPCQPDLQNHLKSYSSLRIGPYVLYDLKTPSFQEDGT